MLALTIRPHRPAGLTLIEVMVALAIVAILGLVAVPSFVAYQRNSELSSAANSLLSAVTMARSEAMKRNLKVLVVPFSENSWASGWKVFADNNKDGTFSLGDDVIAQRDALLPSYFATPVGTNNAAAGTPGGPYLMFDGSGYAANRGAGSVYNLSIQFSRTDDTSPRQKRFLIVAVTGRARVCTPTVANDALCNASNL
ncbi:GspH/FimT family pseudopilin [Xylophilus ampelinus]|uniref:GspH/FimT family pseudopilin n=1 Tax=Xylophilus ampelinus TaxID=54067 RepID=UPI000D7C8BE4|nr:GspH/FimT family pseudopilin [Xylophilus ampelinus]MCS4509842.1 GspH/FimT family pseudopilin [Xylophilus ampelinus]